MVTPEHLADFEQARSRAYELLGDAAEELRREGLPGSPPPGSLAAAALVEALRLISAAEDALDRMSG
ncbi:hypothetical protein ACVGVM_13515 [Pseudonocardia bannensis]|uniref:Uncharacterized protein n=1 Tax=Pseudonocardia bannensis TaxID=630973 RepID=A0A848DD96_9PSEU|nr:hypothetical protein [Pseudonocardia bannensis]NMH90555.1 hypothetical protein [Pseudonocardia bannensis]